jgi:hypothetical protein
LLPVFSPTLTGAPLAQVTVTVPGAVVTVQLFETVTLTDRLADALCPLSLLPAAIEAKAKPARTIEIRRIRWRAVWLPMPSWKDDRAKQTSSRSQS